MATHSSILAWRIPWTEEPGGLQLKRSQRVGHDWANKHTHHIIFLFYVKYSACYRNTNLLLIRSEESGRAMVRHGPRYSAFSFLRILCISFHSGFSNLHSHWLCTRVSFSPYPHQYLSFVDFEDSDNPFHH